MPRFCCRGLSVNLNRCALGLPFPRPGRAGEALLHADSPWSRVCPSRDIISLMDSPVPPREDIAKNNAPPEPNQPLQRLWARLVSFGMADRVLRAASAVFTALMLAGVVLILSRFYASASGSTPAQQLPQECLLLIIGILRKVVDGGKALAMSAAVCVRQQAGAVKIPPHGFVRIRSSPEKSSSGTRFSEGGV